MPARMLGITAIITLCFANAVPAVAGERPWQPAHRDSYAGPAAPYKADRLSRGQKILDVPGQTTVLTRQVLDDMKATSVKDAMRSTAGVTVGR